MATLKDHNGREIHSKQMGDMVKYWSDDRYYVIAHKHTALRDIVLLMEKFYE